MTHFFGPCHRCAAGQTGRRREQGCSGARPSGVDARGEGPSEARPSRCLGLPRPDGVPLPGCVRGPRPIVWEWSRHRRAGRPAFSRHVGRCRGTIRRPAAAGSPPRDGPRLLVDHAIRRLILIYSVAFSYSGIPLIYMGDELALLNDQTYEKDPALADNNRWMHRPRMDWDAAARRTDRDTVESRVFPNSVG
jgi:hypothetical protein